jgi:hypothetical protein
MRPSDTCERRQPTNSGYGEILAVLSGPPFSEQLTPYEPCSNGSLIRSRWGRAGSRHLPRLRLLLLLRPPRFRQLGKLSLRCRTHRSATTRCSGLFPLRPHFLRSLGDTLAAGGTHTTTRTWLLRGRSGRCGACSTCRGGAASACDIQCFKCGDGSVYAITFGSEVGENPVGIHQYPSSSIHFQLRLTEGKCA